MFTSQTHVRSTWTMDANERCSSNDRQREEKEIKKAYLLLRGRRSHPNYRIGHQKRSDEFFSLSLSFFFSTLKIPFSSDGTHEIINWLASRKSHWFSAYSWTTHQFSTHFKRNERKKEGISYSNGSPYGQYHTRAYWITAFTATIIHVSRINDRKKCLLISRCIFFLSFHQLISFWLWLDSAS